MVAKGNYKIKFLLDIIKNIVPPITFMSFGGEQSLVNTTKNIQV